MADWEPHGFHTSLPGYGDVTDGSVDYYEMVWEVVDPAAGQSTAAYGSNAPQQTSDQPYEMITE